MSRERSNRECTPSSPFTRRFIGAACLFLLIAGLFWSCKPVQASNLTEKYFSCDPDKRLKSQLTAIRLPSEMASEGDPHSNRGMFSTDRLELIFKNRTPVVINLFEPFTFTARSKSRHDGCKNFTFQFLNGLIFFDYIHGTGNPYAGQQIVVFDQNLKRLNLPPALEKIFRHSMNVEFRGDCISVVGESRADFEFGCIRDRTYTVEKKTLFFSASGRKEYRVLCNTKISPAVVLELDEYLGTPPVNAELIPVAIAKRAELLCREFQRKIKPQSM